MDFQTKIKECTEKIFKMADKADQDKTRPEYHFHGPSQWMDDPNGVIYHKGYYHMMYSLNPDTDKYRAGMVYKTGSSIWKPSEPDWTGGITVWGHARSKDLVHWEHLPVALYPNTENGEYYIWFGCTAINDEGVPVAIYTSIGYEDRNPTDSALQFIAFGDDDLLTWKQPEDINPIITEEVHGGKKIWEWRDPFVFRQGEKTYLILGGKEDVKDGGRAGVFLYEPENRSFTRWKYKGVLFEYPDPDMRGCECPNIVQLGDKWVIFVSLFGLVEYFVGDLDAETCSFTWENNGFADRSSHFYATNVIEDGKKRKLLWGAVEGFQNTSGWNGINSLPREISLNENGKLMQKVPEEVQTLRTEHWTLTGKDENITLKKACAEIIVTCGAEEQGQFQIEETKIRIKPDTVEVENELIPIEADEECVLHIYLDKSMMEIFINDSECFTAMLPPITETCTIQTYGEKIKADIWQLDTKGLFSKYE